MFKQLFNSSSKSSSVDQEYIRTRQEYATPYYGVCHGRIRSSSSMTHNHSLFRSLCTQRWTRACSLSPEAPSFWLAFQAWPALCMHVFVKVQCSTLGSTLEDKCFSFFSTDWRWQWWRTSNSAVTAFIAKRPRVAYSCSYTLGWTQSRHVQITWMLQARLFFSAGDLQISWIWTAVPDFVVSSGWQSIIS